MLTAEKLSSQKDGTLGPESATKEGAGATVHQRTPDNKRTTGRNTFTFQPSGGRVVENQSIEECSAESRASAPVERGAKANTQLIQSVKEGDSSVLRTNEFEDCFCTPERVLSKSVVEQNL